MHDLKRKSWAEQWVHSFENPWEKKNVSAEYSSFFYCESFCYCIHNLGLHSLEWYWKKKIV